MEIYKCKTKGCDGFLTNCPKCGKKVVKPSTYYKELLKSRAVVGNTTNATKKEYLEIYTCEEYTNNLEVWAGLSGYCDGIVETCPKCGKFQFERKDVLAAMKEYLKDTEWRDGPWDNFVTGDGGTFWPHTFIRLLRWIAKEEPEILMKQTNEMISSFEKLVGEYEEYLVPIMDHEMINQCYNVDGETEEEADEWYKGEAYLYRQIVKEGLEKLINHVEFRT